MVLLIHIAIACSSLVYTALVFLHPSKTKLHIAYSLVAATVASGVMLVIAKPAAMTQSCETGLMYLAFISVGIWATRNKLASQLKIR